jgi:hypothetical protein
MAGQRIIASFYRVYRIAKSYNKPRKDRGRRCAATTTAKRRTTSRRAPESAVAT